MQYIVLAVPFNKRNTAHTYTFIRDLVLTKQLLSIINSKAGGKTGKTTIQKITNQKQWYFFISWR